MKFKILLCFFFFSFSCAQNTPQDARNLPIPKTESTLSDFEKTKRIEKAKQNLREAIKEVSKRFRLSLLEDQKLPDGDLIVRVWRFSAFADKDLIFIFQRKSNVWSANLVEKTVKNENDIKGALVEIKTIELGKPKSDWESFWLKLVNAEILVLPNDNEVESVPCTDCWLYTVEAKVDGIYQVYDCNAPEINKDLHKSQQMIKIIQIISEEFNRNDFDIDNFQKP